MAPIPADCFEATSARRRLAQDSGAALEQALLLRVELRVECRQHPGAAHDPR
jgi:hypothetical protein